MIGGGGDSLSLMVAGSYAPETGFIGTIIDAADGGPQKRRRTREALRLAAQARAEADKLTKEANALSKMTDPSGLAAEVYPDGRFAMPASSSSSGSAWDRVVALATATSPIGLPWWAVVAAGGVGVWAVTR